MTTADIIIDPTPILMFLCFMVMTFGAVALFIKHPKGLKRFEAWLAKNDECNPFAPPAKHATEPDSVKKTRVSWRAHGRGQYQRNFGIVLRKDGSSRIVVRRDDGLVFRRRLESLGFHGIADY